MGVWEEELGLQEGRGGRYRCGKGKEITSKLMGMETEMGKATSNSSCDAALI